MSVRRRATDGDRSCEALRRYFEGPLPPGAIFDAASGAYVVPGFPFRSFSIAGFSRWDPSYEGGDDPPGEPAGGWSGGAATAPVYEFAWRTGGSDGFNNLSLPGSYYEPFVNNSSRVHCVRKSDRPAWEALMPPFAGAQFWREEFEEGSLELEDDAEGLTGFPLCSIEIPITTAYEFWGQATLGTLTEDARINLWIGAGELVDDVLEAEPIAFTHRMTPAAFSIGSTGAGAADELVPQGSPAEALLMYGFSTELVKGDLLFLYATSDQALSGYGSAQLILKTLS